jgi:hypothetical protein
MDLTGSESVPVNKSCIQDIEPSGSIKKRTISWPTEQALTSQDDSTSWSL